MYAKCMCLLLENVGSCEKHRLIIANDQSKDFLPSRMHATAFSTGHWLHPRRSAECSPMCQWGAGWSRWCRGLASCKRTLASNPRSDSRPCFNRSGPLRGHSPQIGADKLRCLLVEIFKLLMFLQWHFWKVRWKISRSYMSIFLELHSFKNYENRLIFLMRYYNIITCNYKQLFNWYSLRLVLNILEVDKFFRW